MYFFVKNCLFYLHISIKFDFLFLFSLYFVNDLYKFVLIFYILNFLYNKYTIYKYLYIYIILERKNIIKNIYYKHLF